MAILASDNFDRANENPLGNGVWTTGSGATAMRIVTNVATPTDISTTDDISYYSGISWPADQFSRAKLTVSSTAGGNRGPTLVVRQASGANTHYRLTADHAATNNVVVAKVVAGTFTALTGFPVTQAWTDGDTWELQVQESSLKAFLNGVQIGPTATDTAITSGSAGIGVSVDVTSASINDWEGGSVDAAGARGTYTGVRRRQGGQRGPFDRRGFLVRKYWDYALLAAVATVFDVDITESVSVADTQTTQADFSSARSDALSVTETEDGSVLFTVSRTDALTAAENQTGLAVFVGGRTEALTAVDTESGFAAFSSALSESLAAVDSSDGNIGAATYNVTRVEALSLADSETTAALFAGARAESVVVADSNAATAVLAASRTDTVSVQDTETGEIAITAVFSMRIEGGPTMTASITTGRTLTASITGGTTLTSLIDGGPS